MTARRAGPGAARSAAVITAVLASAALGCSTPADTPPEASAEASVWDEAEVIAAVEAYNRATETRDESAIRGALAGDGRYAWYEGGELRYTSADDVVASLATFPPDQPIRTTFSDMRVAPVGAGGAWVNATFQTDVGNGAFAFGGQITFVLERTDEGWKILGGRTD